MLKKFSVSRVWLFVLAIFVAVGAAGPRFAVAAEIPTYDSVSDAYKAVVAEWRDWAYKGGDTSGVYTVNKLVLTTEDINSGDLQYAYVADNDFGPQTLVIANKSTGTTYGIYQYLPDTKAIAFTLATAKRADQSYFITCNAGFYRYYWCDPTTGATKIQAVRPSTYTKDDTQYWLVFDRLDEVEYNAQTQPVPEAAIKAMEEKFPTATTLTWNDLNADFVAPSDTYLIPMLRVYNQYSGEHLYTQSPFERDSLVKLGWTDEGVAWVSPSVSKTPVYRLYNSYSGDHHYTTDINEYTALGAIGWTQEGTGFYSDDNQGMAVYRLFNSFVTIGTHHYTTSSAEYDALAKAGWTKENIAWYGVNVINDAEAAA